MERVHYNFWQITHINENNSDSDNKLHANLLHTVQRAHCAGLYETINKIGQLMFRSVGLFVLFVRTPSSSSSSRSSLSCPVCVNHRNASLFVRIQKCLVFIVEIHPNIVKPKSTSPKKRRGNFIDLMRN